MDPILARVIGAIKVHRQTWMEGAMEFPKPDPFDHGAQVGVYQGLSEALNVIETVLEDLDKAEQRL